MNVTENSVSGSLLIAPYEVNIWLGSFLWIAGNVGCIGNIVVFCSSKFRRRAYSIYLVSEAASDFVYFNFVLLTRIIQKGFQFPIIGHFNAICKIRQFISVWGNQVSFSLFSLATIDRLLSTQRSHVYRQWSNRTELAYRISLLCVLFWFIIFSHRLALYSAVNGNCAGPSGLYSYIDNYMEVFFVGICPPIAMLVLSYLLIRSVRSALHRRVHNNDVTKTETILRRSILQQMDSRLTLMLILQSIIAVITYLPYGIELIYSNITQYWFKSALRKAQEKLFVETVHVLSYVFFATSFYVSIISNIGFRKQIKRIFKSSAAEVIVMHQVTVAQTNEAVQIVQTT